MVMRSRQPTGGMRPDAEENPTLRPQECRSGTGLQATGHQQGPPSRQAEKTATIRPKFRVHLGNSGQQACIADTLDWLHLGHRPCE